MRTIALFVLSAWAALAAPTMILTPTVITALKARATANTTEWQALSTSCEYYTTFTASTPDNLPPVYSNREPLVYGTPTGYLEMGDSHYQGSIPSYAMGNLAVCYIVLRDGDVDVAGSTSGTTDEVTLSAKYLTQALKALDKMTYPMPYITVVSAAKWESRTRRPYWYINGTTGAQGTCASGEHHARMYFEGFGLVAGDSFTIESSPGLPALEGNTYKVGNSTNSPANPTAASFYMIDGSNNPVCLTSDSTNTQKEILDDDGYPARNFVPIVSLMYDWIKEDISAPLVAQIKDHVASWVSEFKGYDQSIKNVQYEIRPGSNYHWGWYTSIALAGIAFYNDDARAQVWYDDWRNSWHLMRDQTYMAKWYGNNGGFHEGYRYLPLVEQGLTLALLANYTAMGDDLTAHSTQPFSFYFGQMRFFRQTLQPDKRKYMDRGFIAAPNGPSQLPWETGRIDPSALTPILFAADMLDHPDKNKFRTFVAEQRALADTFTGFPSRETPIEWQQFLFWDPDGTQTTWDDDDLDVGLMSTPLGGYGVGIMRNNWTSDQVMATFWPGPYATDPGNAKERWDKGSLEIQRGQTHLLVHPMAECLRDLPPVYAGNTAQYSNSTACNGAFNNQGANASYLGGTSNSTWYVYKPGQQFGPLQTPPQGNTIKNGSWTVTQPGSQRAPDCMVAGTPYQKAPTYTVDATTDVFTLDPSGFTFANNDVAIITYGSGLTEGAPPSPLVRGTAYYMVSKSGDTFKLSATRGGAPLDITSTGTGTQYIYVGSCGTSAARSWDGPAAPNYLSVMESSTDPSGDAYAYMRGINLQDAFYYDLAWSAHYPAALWERDIYYLKTKNLFLVGDYTKTTNKTSASTRTISATPGCTDTTPTVCTTTASHGYTNDTSVTVSGASVGAYNGTWPITVLSTTTFSLTGSTAAGASTGGSVTTSNLVYSQLVQWTVGKTPTSVTPPSGMAARWNIEDGATWKGRITQVSPASATPSITNVNSYGLVYLLRSVMPGSSTGTCWVTAVDASASEVASAELTLPTSQDGLCAVIVDDTKVVSFVKSDATFPVSIQLTPSSTVDLTVTGLTPSTAYYITQGTDGFVYIDTSGSGAAFTASSAGLIAATLEIGGEITIPPPTITTTTLPAGEDGVAYSQALSASNGTTPYVWTVDSGTLPTGLSLSTGGVISGTPSAAGTYNFTVLVTDAAMQTDTQALSIEITTPSTPVITTTTLAPGLVGAAYSQSVAAINGDTPYTWAIASGALPAGLSLNTGTGAITGTPTTSGTSNFTVTVTDNNMAVSPAVALSISISSGVATGGSTNANSTANFK